VKPAKSTFKRDEGKRQTERQQNIPSISLKVQPVQTVPDHKLTIWHMEFNFWRIWSQWRRRFEFTISIMVGFAKGSISSEKQPHSRAGMVRDLNYQDPVKPGLRNA